MKRKGAFSQEIDVRPKGTVGPWKLIWERSPDMITEDHLKPGNLGGIIIVIDWRYREKLRIGRISGEKERKRPFFKAGVEGIRIEVKAEGGEDGPQREKNLL